MYPKPSGSAALGGCRQIYLHPPECPVGRCCKPFEMNSMHKFSPFYVVSTDVETGKSGEIKFIFPPFMVLSTNVETYTFSERGRRIRGGRSPKAAERDPRDYGGIPG